MKGIIVVMGTNNEYMGDFGSRWHVAMPKILQQSISILSDAGLGMAMFSLGISNFIFLFLGLQCQ